MPLTGPSSAARTKPEYRTYNTIARLFFLILRLYRLFGARFMPPSGAFHPSASNALSTQHPTLKQGVESGGSNFGQLFPQNILGDLFKRRARQPIDNMNIPDDFKIR